VSQNINYKEKYFEVRRQLQEEKANHLKAMAELDKYLHTPEPPSHSLEINTHELAELDRIKQEVKELKAAHETAQQRVAELEQENTRLNQKINNPRMWTSEFVKPFAESLEAMRNVYGATGLDRPRAVKETFQAWHQEIETTVMQLQEGEFEMTLSERARRILICQWVYLRWLEVSRLD
jgi:predicted nuclease with TOPRIM domain